MPETIDPLAMSDEVEQMMFEMMHALRNGGTVPPELVDRLNGEGFRVNSEKFRAAQIVAGHNVPAIAAADKLVKDYKAAGYDESYIPQQYLHPMLWKIAQVEYQLGDQTFSYFTYAMDKPYYLVPPVHPAPPVGPAPSKGLTTFS